METAVQSRVTNHTIHLFKGAACISVVFIHVLFPGMFGTLVANLCGYAVPFFLMVSGYYALGAGETIIRHRLQKIVRLFLCGYLLFFLYTGAVAWRYGALGGWLAKNFTWVTPIQYLLFCNIDFAIPLWYLIAMLETYLLWLFVVKKHKETWIVKSTVWLFLAQLVLTSVCETLALPWLCKTNFITRALAWFAAGYWFHSSGETWVKKIPAPALCATAAVGGLITVLPTLLSSPLKVNCIGYIPLTFSLFALTLQYPQVKGCGPLRYLGAHLTASVYLLHVPLIGIIDTILGETLHFPVDGRLYPWCRPLVAVAAAVGVALVLEYLKRKIRKS